MVNSKFHLIRSYCEIFFYHFPNISCLKCTVNSNFHLIRSKILPMNDFELTVPNLYPNTTASHPPPTYPLLHPPPPAHPYVFHHCCFWKFKEIGKKRVIICITNTCFLRFIMKIASQQRSTEALCLTVNKKLRHSYN